MNIKSHFTILLHSVMWHRCLMCCECSSMLILGALRPIIKWKVQEQTVQSRLRCPLRLKAISWRRHKKEKRQMVTYGLKSKQRWHILTNMRGGDSTIRSLDQDHQCSGSTATRPEHLNAFKTLRSHPWLPNWTGPQTFLKLHHNYKHDATGFCGVMEGKGEWDLEEEEKWVKGTTGGNTILSWLWRGAGLIRREETAPGTFIQTKQELKLCGLILWKLSRNVWIIVQPQIKRSIAKSL